VRAAVIRLLLVSVFGLVLSSASLRAHQPEPDPWGFEEEQVETLGDIIRPQIPDLVVLTGFFALALVSFFRKSVALKYAVFAIAIGYLGFYKSYLLSIVNVFSVIGWNLPIFKYNLAWYLFFLFAVISTVLWGRLYCGRICAYGALTQVMDEVIPAKLRIEPPYWLEKRANKIKYGILAGVVAYFLATSDMTIYKYVEPFWMFGLNQSAALWIALAVLLAATVFVRNLYCRFLCPVGAALGLMSYLTVFRIKRWSECNSCKLCEKTCKWGAIEGPKIIMTECVRCDDCERLYMDQQKCPHWIILRRKGDKIAVSQA
jgi:NosR/NirI family nitrous oxide reductase transcriptional regulator